MPLVWVPKVRSKATTKAAKGLSPVVIGNLAETDPLHHPHRTSCFPSQGPERVPEIELGVRGQEVYGVSERFEKELVLERLQFVSGAFGLVGVRISPTRWARAVGLLRY